MADRRLAVLLLLYLALAVLYGAANPLFEAPDEPEHYFTAQYIADTWRLPAVTPETEPWLGQEAAQPPLYYLLGALIIAPVETEGARRRLAEPALRPRRRQRSGEPQCLCMAGSVAAGRRAGSPSAALFSALPGAGTLLFSMAAPAAGLSG